MPKINIYALFQLLFFLISGTCSSASAFNDTASVNQNISKTKKVISIGSNAIFPGIGHHMVDNRRVAFLYFTLETCLVFSGILAYARGTEDVVEHSKQYAENHSGANIRRNDDEYWNVIGYFRSSDEYNETMDLVRDSEKRYLDPNDQWSWYNEEFIKEYNSLRQSEKETTLRRSRLRKASFFLFGSAVVNSIISTTHLIRYLKKENKSPQRFSNVKINSYCDFKERRADFSVSVNF